MNKSKIIASALACFFATSALAQSGRTSRGQLPAPNTPAPGNSLRGVPSQRGADRELLNAALDFFKEHSPLRAAAYEQMPPDQRRGYNAILTDRYIAFLSAENDELRKCLSRQLEIEDTVFDLKRRLDALAPGAPESDALKEGLHGAVSEMVEVRFRERAVRIARMGQLLAEERALLEKDRENKDQIINQRFEEIFKTQRADPTLPEQKKPGDEPPARGPRLGAPRGRSE